MVDDCYRWLNDAGKKLYAGVGRKGALVYAELPVTGPSRGATAKNSLTKGSLDVVFGVTTESVPPELRYLRTNADVCYLQDTEGKNEIVCYDSAPAVDNVLSEMFLKKKLKKVTRGKIIPRLEEAAWVYRIE